MSDSPIGRTREFSILDETVAFFTSVRTAVVLLFILAGASIVGTVVPQETSLDQVSRVVSPFVFRLIAILDLNNVYRSWWFLLLLTLLTVNLLACLLQRIPALMSEWKDSARKRSIHLNFETAQPVSHVKTTVLEAVRPMMGAPRQESKAGGGFTLEWVRHRAHLLAFPFIHIGIVTIIFGGLVGLMYGYRGHILLREGETRSEFTLRPSDQVRRLPFEIAVERFTLTRYPTGEPKEFRSDVRLIENGREVVNGRILVNQPLTYRGISLYQSDYRTIGVREATICISGPDRKDEEIVLSPREKVKLPGDGPEVQLVALDPGTTGRGPGAQIKVERPGSETETLWLYEKDAEAVKLGAWEARFRGYRPLYATGLQIGYDPGSVLVWIGSIVLVIGIGLTLFTNHRRLTVEIAARGGRTILSVAGSSRRMRREFREKIAETVRGALGEPPK
ncbi:MAG: cytochrome c biogenesis protein ResB [Desulfomonile sp.]|nr:cytochrome c biogenesis protein ResB [Desulfomonile sp.]